MTTKTYPTKFFNDNMQNAPQMSDDSLHGQVAGILKACLVTGFGALAPDSIVWDATEGVAKASFSGGHSYEKHSIVIVSGVSPIEYNGEHRIVKVATNEVWFELDDGITPVDATVAGELKIAPLGWTLEHSNAENDILILKPNVDGNVSLRIDNSAYSGWSGSYARHCKVAMVEDVVDINTYTTIYEHRLPATDRYSSGGWELVGNSAICFFVPRYASGNKFAPFVLGYIDSHRAGDKYHFAMTRLPSTDLNNSSNRWDQNNSSYSCYNNFLTNGDTSHNVMARKYHQLEGTTSFKKQGIGSYGSDLMKYPDPVTNGFYINVQPQVVLESDGSWRGTMPILVEPLANNFSLHRKTIDNLPEHEGKIFRFVSVSYSSRSDHSSSLMGFDISTVEVV